jgi:NAD-dependent deacetylase
MPERDDIQRAAEILQGSKALAVMTGAGVSAESGVPTFRGAGGLWEGYRAEEVATPEAFARDPQLVWRFYCWRREGLAKCRPNPAHQAIAELERRWQPPRRFCLITQNVDGLHVAAGSENIVEIHGTLAHLRCHHCRRRADWPEPLGDMPPGCPECGGPLRPAVVWFGEMLPEDGVHKATEAIETCDVMLVVGTSAIVHPVASWVMAAKYHGAKIIVVNLESTAHADVADVGLLGKAGEILPQVLSAVED